MGKGNYKLNNFRVKKFDENKFLITTDHGSWTLLNKSQYDLLKSEKITDSLYKLLEEKGIILTKENENKIIEEYKEKNSFLFQGPSLHIVIPTLRCNYQCIYCHASSKQPSKEGFDMDKETAKKTVEFIFKSPSDYINIEFQGGEPLMNFDIVKYIIDYSTELNKKYKKDLMFTLVTNLSCMNNERLEYFIKNNVGICTSLDGPKKLHDENRKFLENSSYDVVAKWAKIINEEYAKRNIKERRLNALITITKESLKYPQEILNTYLDLGFKDIHLRFLNNLGDARPIWSKISYSSEEFIDFWKKMVDYILELNKKGIPVRERMAFIMLKKIFDKKDPNYMDLRSPCGAAIGQLTYNYNGDIYTCDEARMIGDDIFKIGNVKENSYKEVLTSDSSCAIIASSINDVYICDACAYKPYCGLCPVCNYAEQGGIIAKIAQTNRCKIFKAQFTYIFDKLVNNKEAEKIFLDWIERP